MISVVHKLKHEFLSVLPPTIFFLIALHIIGLVRALMTKGTGVDPVSSAQIVVAALLLGKAVLIADMLPWINLYPHKPLVYNVAWKTAIYLAIAALLHYFERLYDVGREAGSLAAANAALAQQFVWQHFLAIQIILLVQILMYTTGRELIRVIGKDKVKRMFFGPPPMPKF
jgi:hypothetical protein